MTSVFRASGVSVSFGGVRALVGVDLEIEAGELVGLIGPNGAGKTTFIDAVTGFVRYAGEVELDGAKLDGLAPQEFLRRAVAGFPCLGRRHGNHGLGAKEPSTVPLARWRQRR